MIFLITTKIVLFVIFLCALGFFNGAETAITSMSSASLRSIKEKEEKYFNRITSWETNTQEIMTAMIIGMNLSLVGMGVILSSLESDILYYYNINSKILTAYFPIISIVLALLLGNIFPKTIARYNSKKIGMFVLPIVMKFLFVFKFVINFLLSISNKIVKVFIKDKETEHVKAHEIDFLLSNENTSPLPEDSREIVSNIMDFSENKISQVMMPISEVFAIDIDLPEEEIIKRIIDNRYSRVPVYKGNINNIIGVVYAKDLAVVWRNSKVIVLQDLIRPVYFAPENAKISKILKEFKTGHHHIAIVVDEFGATIGIASMEDLVEEIVGEVWDEYDIREKTIVKIAHNKYMIQAYEAISVLNNELKINIPEGNYTTVNGWVLNLFGRIPQVGQKIDWNDYTIEIHDADLKKVNRIVLKKCTTR
ncbi:MAG: hemolysin family protein [Endomicrobium sp.]|jgi:putative hemolysin|nr:hemolysin family protein [Endomicrobium sp.]